MPRSHNIQYNVGTTPEGASTRIPETYYNDSGTPVPQIEDTDVNKFLKAGSDGKPTWASIAAGGTWGSITGTLSDQTDLMTEFAKYVTLSGSQTITGAKTFAISGQAYSTVLDNVRLDAVQNLGNNKSYESSLKSGGFRSAYIDENSRYTGFRIFAPTNIATSQVSKIEHYVTRNNVQSTYTIELPEKNGTIAIEKSWTKILDSSTGGVQFGFNLSGYSEFCMMVYTTNTSDAQLLLHYGASSNVWMASITGSENTNVLYKHYVNGPVVPECVCSETSVSVSASATTLFGPTVPTINGISITSGSISMITLYAR